MPREGDRVCILLGLYNAGEALAEQLESFVEQTHADWDLLASDDGSTDGTVPAMEAFARRMGTQGRRVELADGPGTGATANFMSLLERSPEGAAWLALSDQDDVWLPDRLSRGLAALSSVPYGLPALYCSRTWVADANLARRRLSIRFLRPPSFRNALVQNIASGNTILLNRSAAALARVEAPRAAATARPGTGLHDWWLYQIVTGAGGRVVHDPEPTLLYRQHGGNLVGSNDGNVARFARIRMLLAGRFRDWNAANILALKASSSRLTPENRAILEGFSRMRESGLFGRLLELRRLGLYRQSRAGQLALWVAAALNRV